MIRDTKKIISILQLKFLIRFAQALFNPKGNSSKNLYTLESIWGITVGQFRKSRPKYPNSWERTYKVMKSLQLNISHSTMPYSSCFKVIWESSVIQYLGHWENFLGGLDPNKAQMFQIMGINTQKVIYPKCYIPHFTSNEALLKYKYNLRFDLFLF